MCEPHLCPDSPEGGRCGHCPQDKLDAAQQSEKGYLLRRALDLRGALKLGVNITLEDIRADEFYAMLIVEEERDKFDNEKANPDGQQQPSRTGSDGRR